MALVNPNIALGVQPVQMANPLAQYGQIAQLQAAQNQNALAQYQLGAAKRGEETQNVLAQAYAQSVDPDTGKIDYNKLTKLVASGGGGAQLPGIEKTRRETETAVLTQQKAQSDLLDAKLKQSRGFLDTIDPADPTAPAKYLAWHEANHRDPIIGAALEARGVSAEQARQSIEAAIAKGPADFAKMLNQSKLGTEKFMEMNKPTLTPQTLGGTVRVLQTPGLGGPTEVVPGSVGAVTMTPAQIETNRIAQGQLTLAQRKFAFEQANPGYELKEGENGQFYGVNKRTLQAVPITVGGGAPAAAPVAPGAGIPGPRVAQPGAVTQAIPGMTSVLDQQAPAAAPVAGGAQPFMGKGTALTEAQGNATAYGMRMLDANKVLADLEKAGTTSGGRISGAVGGTLNALVPYQGEKLAEGAESVMNVLPGVLGGPNEAQQQYSQAKRNFITAVLRKESGAAIAPSEFATEEKKYFPQAGDAPKVLEQKQKARELAIRAMKIQAGPGAKSIGDGSAPAAVADPLGIR